MSDYPILKPSDFILPGQSNYGLNRSERAKHTFSKEWIAKEIKATSQLNPSAPFVRVPFPITFFGLYRKS